MATDSTTTPDHNMAIRRSSSISDSSVDERRRIRKRVTRACERCRVKKTKCDGAHPCRRCSESNSICTFKRLEKTGGRVYPKGYIEILEQQQTWLVDGIQKLYHQLQEGKKWQGEPVKCQTDGSPLVHDILSRLDVIDSGQTLKLEPQEDVKPSFVSSNHNDLLSQQLQKQPSLPQPNKQLQVHQSIESSVLWPEDTNPFDTSLTQYPQSLVPSTCEANLLNEFPTNMDTMYSSFIDTDFVITSSC